jgi:hypothetical protein
MRAAPGFLKLHPPDFPRKVRHRKPYEDFMRKMNIPKAFRRFLDTERSDSSRHRAGASEMTPWRQMPVRMQRRRPFSPCTVSV